MKFNGILWNIPNFYYNYRSTTHVFYVYMNFIFCFKLKYNTNQFSNGGCPVWQLLESV